MKDIEHPDQADPFLRDHPERELPAVKAPHDSAEVINATREGTDLEKLAEAAGVDPEQLDRLKQQMGRR